MASLIRFPGETDAEYARRTSPVIAAVVAALRRNNLAISLLEDPPLMKAMRLNELRLSCGVKPKGETFKWDVVHDGRR